MWFMSERLLRWSPVVIFFLAIISLMGSYRWAHQKGFHSRDNEISELTSQLKQYQDQYDRWIRETEKAALAMQQEQDALIRSLEDQLNEQRLKVQEKQIVYRDREITKYIPVTNDTVLPLGFIWLYAHSLQGQTLTDSSLYPISGTTGRDPGADSGVTLSDLVQVIEQNHLRCLQYRGRLEIWNQWYKQSKSNYEETSSAYQSYSDPYQIH